MQQKQRKSMKIIKSRTAFLFFLLICALGVFMVIQAAAKNDKSNTPISFSSRYTSSDPSFSLFFPSSPTINKTTVVLGSAGEHTIRTAITSNANNETFTLAYFVFPKSVNLTDIQKILVNTGKWEVNTYNIGGFFYNPQPTTFANFPAIDYLVKNGIKKTYSKSKSFLVNETFYSLTVTSKEKDVKNADKFFSSFRLTITPTPTQ